MSKCRTADGVLRSHQNIRTLWITVGQTVPRWTFIVFGVLLIDLIRFCLLGSMFRWLVSFVF